jgi:uncharacterized membrane protein YkvA (DUF1232 family)
MRNIDSYLNWAKAKFYEQAKNILKSSEGLNGLANSVDEKLKSQFIKDQFKGIWEDLKIIIPLLKDTATGIYHPHSKKNLVLIVIGLLYFLNPMDVIPDLIVGGLIDDAAVLTWIFTKVKDEIHNYRATKNP